MKIIKVEKFGGYEELQEIEEPDPKAENGQIVVGVKAAGINFADVAARAGHYPGVPSAPFYPGLEVSGIVMEVGPDVNGFAEGDRVMSFVPNHGYSSVIAVDAKTAVKLPSELDFAAATALLVQGLTAYFLLENARLSPGNSVLISSAAGGLGSLAVQVAKLKGAGSVIGLASPGKHARVLDLGADHVIDYNEKDWSQKVLEATGNAGVDIFLDSSGDLAGPGFDTLGSGSRWLIYGGQSTRGEGLTAQRLGTMISKSITLRGYSVYYDVANFGRALHELVSWAVEGKLKIDVQSFPLSDVAAAHQAIEERKTFGKVVLIP